MRFWCKTSGCAKCSKKLLTAYVCTQAHSWECTISTVRKLPKKRVFKSGAVKRGKTRRHNRDKKQHQSRNRIFCARRVVHRLSGNCYLSSKEQGASGNRGLCKQMCRLPYRAEVQGKSCDGYLLSARDLCLYSSLKELADAGVCSFKSRADSEETATSRAR